MDSVAIAATAHDAETVTNGTQSLSGQRMEYGTGFAPLKETVRIPYSEEAAAVPARVPVGVLLEVGIGSERSRTVMSVSCALSVPLSRTITLDTAGAGTISAAAASIGSGGGEQ